MCDTRKILKRNKEYVFAMKVLCSVLLIDTNLV